MINRLLKHISFFILIFVFTLLFFLDFPLIFFGDDITTGIQSSFHLLNSSLFSASLYDNFFVRFLAAGQGYWTVTFPSIIYFFVFELASLEITNLSLSLANYFIGLLLISFTFLFSKNFLGSINTFFILLIAVCTVEFFSILRVSSGFLIYSSFFSFLVNLTFARYLFTGKSKDLILYSIFLFMYIGSDPSFFLLLFCHFILFLFILFKGNESKTKIKYDLKILVLWAIPIFGFFVLQLVIFDYFGGITKAGYLSRLFIKLQPEAVLDTYSYEINFFLTPLVVLCFISVMVFIFFYAKRKFLNNITSNFLYINIVFLIFLVLGMFLLGSKYYMYLCLIVLPVTSIVVIALNEVTHKSKIFLFSFFAIINLIFTISTYMNFLDLKSYLHVGGPQASEVKIKDQVLKSLAYQVRENNIETNFAKQSSHILNLERKSYGIFTAGVGNGAWYFDEYILGRYENFSKSNMEQYEAYYVLCWDQLVMKSKENENICKYSKNYLYLIANYQDSGKVHAQLYSNKKANYSDIDIEVYSDLFHNQFSTIEDYIRSNFFR